MVNEDEAGRGVALAGDLIAGKVSADDRWSELIESASRVELANALLFTVSLLHETMRAFYDDEAKVTSLMQSAADHAYAEAPHHSAATLLAELDPTDED